MAQPGDRRDGSRRWPLVVDLAHPRLGRLRHARSEQPPARRHRCRSWRVASALPLAAAAPAPRGACTLVTRRRHRRAAVPAAIPLDAAAGPAVSRATCSVVAYGGGPRRSRRWVVASLAVVRVRAGCSPLALAADRDRASGRITTGAGRWAARLRRRLDRRRPHPAAPRADGRARGTGPPRAERDAERERRLAAAEERTRIARELHDSAGHAINVILVQAGAARLLHEPRPGPVAARRSPRSRRSPGTPIGEIDRLVRALREDDGRRAARARRPGRAGRPGRAAPAGGLRHRHRRSAAPGGRCRTASPGRRTGSSRRRSPTPPGTAAAAPPWRSASSRRRSRSR